MNQATRIKIKLMTRGISQAELAEELRVTNGMVSMVIRGDRTSDRIRKHIARRLGCSPRELFGEAAERRRKERRRIERRRSDCRKRGVA